MSFSGDLEHLPIVDVIQLLHATRKSGILRVKCRKGESQLVFKDGYMVSANHLNNSVRIGKILSDLNVISPEMLDEVLQEQAAAGQNRKPLIITLLEKGYVKEEDAYKGLEQLIEMTIVDILTWKKGVFTLDVLPPDVSDEYKYYPDKMSLEVNVDTQSILMDALRIYDEKMRDGELEEEEEDDRAADESSASNDDIILSADDLGLGELDQLEKKIPAVFKTLDEKDPGKVHRNIIKACAPELSVVEQEELVVFLQQQHPDELNTKTATGNGLSLIFLSPDELMSHAVTTVGRSRGIPVFATNEDQNLDPIIGQSLSRNNLPILAFDAPVNNDPRFSPDNLAFLRRQKRARYPHIPIIQLASARNPAFMLQSFGDGGTTVFPRALREESADVFVAETKLFLESLGSFLAQYLKQSEATPTRRLNEAGAALRTLQEAPEIARALLEFVGTHFERAVTLIVRGSELIVERNVGIRDECRGSIAPALGMRIPLDPSSRTGNVVETGTTYLGAADDAMKRDLFTTIGEPLRPVMLLLPLRNRGKTVAVTYADFGQGEVARVDLDLLEMLASHAELVLENALYRKRTERPVESL